MEFWDYTPAELNTKIEIYIEEKKEEAKQRIVQAYATAVLQRVKRMPRLEKLLEEEKQHKIMTEKEMFEIVKTLNSTFGGEMIGNS